MSRIDYETLSREDLVDIIDMQKKCICKLAEDNLQISTDLQNNTLSRDVLFGCLKKMMQQYKDSAIFLTEDEIGSPDDFKVCENSNGDLLLVLVDNMSDIGELEEMLAEKRRKKFSE